MSIKPGTKYLQYTFLMVIICGSGQYAWNSAAPAALKSSNGFTLLFIFALFTFIVHSFLMYSSKSSSGAFVRSFMASTVLKFFFYIMVLVAFLLYSKDNKQALILHFLFYYVIFTVFEVSILYRELQKPN